MLNWLMVVVILELFLKNGNGGAYDTVGGSVIIGLSASDTVVVKHYHNSGITNNTYSGANTTFFGGFKLIGVS